MTPYFSGLIFALLLLGAALWIERITRNLESSSYCGHCGKRMRMGSEVEHLIACYERQPEEVIPVEAVVIGALEYLRESFRREAA